MVAVAFQTRARTIDHLGRGQIADTPTAVSELWKNAYDAYARNVSLHIFPSDPPVAAIVDDGVGMGSDDILQRWLVVGTESKVEDDGGPSETFGLPLRPRQGEKGIGRLSVAFLAPTTLLLSRKEGGPFAAVLVDWRLFENPFITLEDLQLPVETFQTAADVVAGLAGMAKVLRANLGGKDEGRPTRLAAAWARYSDYETKQGLAPTAKTIEKSCDEFALDVRHLQEWPVFVGLGTHGTAMFMIGIHHELAIWTAPGPDTDEVEMVKARLKETLTGFTDPFAEPRPEFDYEVWVHRNEGPNTRVVAASDVFGAGDLHDLEHYLDGDFDEEGVFTGKVVAFGEDFGIRTFKPAQQLPKGKRERLGPFKFCIGTFEQDLRRSTFEAEKHQALADAATDFGGVTVYRDDLRVMPYGREEADFLGIEARRSKHAGRYFWAHRRSFGRIAFTRANNPNLRDKAGREGLVDNRARRELRIVVQKVLIDAANLFFGTDSETRRDLLPQIIARNAAAKAAAEQARSSRRRNLRSFLKESRPPLDDAIMRVEALSRLASSAASSGDRMEATVLASRYHEMLEGRESLRPPLVGAKLGDLEESYRSYRDGYAAYSAKLDEIGRKVSEVESSVGVVAPGEALERSFEAQDQILVNQLSRYRTAVESRLGDLAGIWRGHAEKDAAVYRERFAHLVDEGVEASRLLAVMNVLDAARAEIEDELAGRYPPFLNALQRLIDGIDLDSAFSATEDDRAALEERLQDLQAVAQVGVTVEIIGHELESLEAEVKRNLNKLPKNVKDMPSFAMAMNAHLALADRLRFLAPMKIGGYRAREQITGAQIADYVAEFFERVFREQSIDFSASPAFRSLRVTDIPSRIYPVFINLVNNAVYWVGRAAERKIRLDLVDSHVVVADSGPGVDVDDVGRLFDLFFTRRRSGRGVGLYLSRVNLAVANHTIRYAAEGDPKVLDGANFIIDFKGLTTHE